MTKLEQSVYIPTLEASTIYVHQYRNNNNNNVRLEFTGMIPSSLELQALVKAKIKIDEKSGKRKSTDLISVRFNNNVKSSKELINDYQQKIKKKENEIARLIKESKHDDKKSIINRREAKIQKCNASIEWYLDKIEHMDEEYESINTTVLRDMLYKEGFTIKSTDKQGKLTTQHYRVYKRSSAKSRTGRVLFIKDKLHDKMMKWSRMGLDFNGKTIDYVALLAYESLVSSSIKDLIKIDTNNIFIIDDQYSKFEQVVNLVSVDGNNMHSEVRNGVVEENIFDGQSLLDEMYFCKDSKSMKLLRNHFFKSAAIRCNVQQYLRDKADEKGIDFENWNLTDCYGNQLFAKDIHLITTPSSLKFIKFKNMVGSGTEAEIYNYWKKIVDAEGSIFGVVKEEKESKFGMSEDGKALQVMSYQMINSLPSSFEDIKELTRYQIDYIYKLKNDMSTYLKYLYETADTTNSNQMMIDLYNHNSKISGTSMFREHKKEVIRKYHQRVQSGKLQIKNADYAVLVGNPIEMLACVTGDFTGDVIALRDNQIYTKMFEFEEELAGFRNPHTSPSNILYSINSDSKLIAKYFSNLSNNIVIVNGIKNPLQNILSGSDFDSDTVLITNDPVLTRLAKQSREKYRVCISDIQTENTRYIVNDEQMAVIDSTLQKANAYIGKVTNTAQLLLSLAWDRESKKEDSTKLWDEINKLTILSGLSIDLAKKKIDTNIIDTQLKYADKIQKEYVDNFPYWWNVRKSDVRKAGGANKNKKMKEDGTPHYNCPMDFLYQVVDSLDDAKRIDNVDIKTLLVKKNTGGAVNSQLNDLDELLDEYSEKTEGTHTRYIDDDQKEENYLARQELTEDIVEKIKKKKIKEDTLYALILKILGNKINNNRLNMLNALYQSLGVVFINAFKRKK